jgi:hypothetical protein
MNSEQDVWHFILDHCLQGQVLEHRIGLAHQQHEEVLMPQPELTATTALADKTALYASPSPTASQTYQMLN